MASTSAFSQSQYFDDTNVRARSDNPKVKAKAGFKAYIRYINRVHAFLTELSKRVQQLEENHVIVMRRRPMADGSLAEYPADQVGVHPTLIVQGTNGPDIRPDQKQFYEQFITRVAKDKNGTDFTTLYTVNGNVLKSLNSEFREMVNQIIMVQEEMERLGKRKKTSTTNSFAMVYRLSEHAMNFFKQMDYTVPHVRISQKQVRVRRPNPPRTEDVMVGIEGTGRQDVSGQLNFLVGDASSNATYGLILSSALTSLFTIHANNQNLSNTREWLIEQGMVQTDANGRIVTDARLLQALLKGNHASDLMRMYFTDDMNRLVAETNGKFSPTSFAHAAFQTVLKTHRTKIDSTFKWTKDMGGDDRSHSKIAYTQSGIPEQHTFADWALTWPGRKGTDGQISLESFHQNVTYRLGEIGQRSIVALIQEHTDAVTQVDQARASGQTVEDAPALNRYIQKRIAAFDANSYAQFITGWNPTGLPDLHRHELLGEVISVLYADSAAIKEGCRHIRLFKKYQEDDAAAKLSAAKSSFLTQVTRDMNLWNAEINKCKTLRAQLQHSINETRMKHEALTKLATPSHAQQQEAINLVAQYNQALGVMAEIDNYLQQCVASYSIANQRKDRLNKAKTVADVAYVASN